MSRFCHICSAISQQAAAAVAVGGGLTGFDGHVDGVAAIPAGQTVLWEHLRMSSPEDPEERIRQLEQQSAGYGAVELGSSGTPQAGAAPTSPLPPPVYPAGDPYQSNPYQPPFGTQYLPVAKKGGMPVGMIIGLVATVIVVIFGGVGAIVWNVMSSTPHVSVGGPGSGSFDIPGGGPTINIPTALPTFPSMPSMPTDTPKAGAPGEQLSVSGVQKNETLACNEANVNVSGVNNTVNLTGHCASVTVSGVNNRVTIENTDKIGASGFDNQVTYQSGDPQIDTTDSNTVQKG
jgi:hypothetical protein